MRAILTIAGLSLFANPIEADGLDIGLEIPQLKVAEYHKPYVAVWLATPNHKVVANLAVWYQQHEGAEGDGKTWLKDLRQWWRRSGRRLDLPVDGVSSPTRAPGTHKVAISKANNDLLNSLPVGDYVLHIEASREVGGRELLRIPFKWPAEAGVATSISGKTELGTVTLAFEKNE